MLNKVFLIGRLTKDPSIRHLPSGSQVVEFSLAYNRRYMVAEEWKEETHFFDVKVFGKLAEDIGIRISKGYAVLVEGRLIQERWTDKEGKQQSKVRILAESVKIVNKPKGEATAEPEVVEDYDYRESPRTPFDSDEDDIPI